MPTNTFRLEGDTRDLEARLEELERKFDDVTGASKKTADQQKKTDSAWVKGATNAGKLAAGLIAAAEGARRLIDEVAGTVDEVGTLAAAAGLANETVNGLRLAADATGKSLTDLVPVGLPKKMLDAANGSEEAARLFRALGVEVTDASGQLRDADKVFGEVIDGLNGLESAEARAGIAAALLEEQGKQLLSAFSDQDDLQRFIDASEKFAIDVGPEAAKQTAQWQQATAELNLAWENVLRALQDSGAFETATQFVKNLALGTVFLTEVTIAFVDQSLERFGALADALRNFPDLEEVFGALIRSESGRLDELFQPLQDALFDANALTGSTEALGDAWDAASEKVGAFFRLQQTGAAAATDATDKGTGAVVKFEAALKKAAEAQRKWIEGQDALIDIIDESESDTLTAIQQVNAEYIARIKLIEQTGIQEGLAADAARAARERQRRDLAAIEKERLQQTSDRLREEEALERQHLQNVADLESAFLELRRESFREFLSLAQESAFATVEGITEVITNLAEAEKERLEAQLEGTQDTIEGLRDERAELEEYLAATENLTAEQKAQADARLAQIAKEINASKGAAKTQRELINEQNRAVLAADNLARAAAIAQIAIDGARTFTGLVAFFAPLIGPGAPAAAAPIAAGVVAAQTAAVVTAPKPTLHDGGVLFGPGAPDERNVGGTTVLNGEAGVVLNQRAVDLGAVERVEAMNRATDMGGPMRLVLSDAGRAFGEAWVQQSQTRGSAVASVVGSPSGFVNPHRRR